jgi:hypothetical protein
LAPALDGASDPFDRARLCDAGPGKSQIQAVQVEIQALRVLDQTPSSSAPPALSSRLLQTSPDSPTPRMALISKSFPQSTRPSLQTLQQPLARSGKCLKGRAKAALTRSSLQTSSRAADGVAAVPPLRDCSRSIAGDGNRVGGSIPMSERGSISVSAKVHLTDWRGLIIVKP